MRAGAIRNWVLAVRPKTLPATVAPVVVGTALAYADGSFALLPALAALVGALLIQIGTNLANDYFDYVKGVDSTERKGPTRVAQSGLITLDRLRIATTLTFALAAAVGLYLVAVGGWPILAIGVASIAAAIGYSGGPYPLGHHGLGDLFVFVFFGLIAVGGTYYVQTLDFGLRVLLVAVPMGTLATAILVVNNLRDIETDRQAGKRTLAVIVGKRATRVEYGLLLGVAYAIPILLRLGSGFSTWVLLPWVTFPLARRLVRTVSHANDGPTLNAALAETARLDLVFALLFAVGLAVG